MKNPTIVVITDRNDLNDQLFGTFARCRDLLPQDPVQAADRADLREKLRVAGGGVFFTTIQKFMPADQGDRNAVLSDRSCILVIADEAHRSQCGFIDGFASHMRDALLQASLVAFTGTCLGANVEQLPRPGCGRRPSLPRSNPAKIGTVSESRTSERWSGAQLVGHRNRPHLGGGFCRVACAE